MYLVTRKEALDGLSLDDDLYNLTDALPVYRNKRKSDTASVAASTLDTQQHLPAQKRPKTSSEQVLPTLAKDRVPLQLYLTCALLCDMEPTSIEKSTASITVPEGMLANTSSIDITSVLCNLPIARSNELKGNISSSMAATDDSSTVLNLPIGGIDSIASFQQLRSIISTTERVTWESNYRMISGVFAYLHLAKPAGNWTAWTKGAELLERFKAASVCPQQDLTNCSFACSRIRQVLKRGIFSKQYARKEQMWTASKILLRRLDWLAGDGLCFWDWLLDMVFLCWVASVSSR